MSRISYDEGYDGPDTSGLWAHSERRAFASARGKAALKELEAALLALPAKRLIESNVCDGSDVCAIGSIALKREIDAGKDREAALSDLAGKWGGEDWYDPYDLAPAFGIAKTVAFRTVEANDEICQDDTPEERYANVLDWVRRKIAASA